MCYNINMSKQFSPSANYDFFIKTDTSKYKGEWIAIAKDRIVAHGKDAEKVYKKAVKKVKEVEISLAKVPEKQMLVLQLSFHDYL